VPFSKTNSILHNLFHYILIFLTIFSADVLINIILAPESNKWLLLLGYPLYFMIIAPMFLLLLHIIKLVSQFSPSDDSSFFAFWSFLLIFAQVFPLLYEYLPESVSGFSLLGALLISISYGIFWTFYAKKTSEAERKVLFLLNQILILSLVQFGTYLNVKYVRELFTKNGLILNLTLVTIFVISILLGRKVSAYIIGKNSNDERLDTDDFTDIVNKIKTGTLPARDWREDKKAQTSASKRAWVFTIFLFVFNLAIFIFVLIFPEKPVVSLGQPNSFSKRQEKLKLDDKPNIVLIVLDSVRAKSMELYGFEKATMPRLTKWASKTTNYNYAYSNSSWSLATHASIFTGLYPSRHKAQYHYSKVFDELDRPITAEDIFQPLAESNKTLAERLSKDGYYTAAFSANNSELDPEFGLSQGFHLYDARGINTPELLPYRLLRPAGRFFAPLTRLYKGYRTADTITDEAAEWCTENQDKKFFLFLNYMEGNLPLLPIPKYKKMYYDDEKVRDARYPEQLKQIMYYYAELRYIDDQLGNFLKSIEKYKWYDNALIIITSSHGISLGEWGHWGHSITVNEREVKIPMLVKYPGQKSGVVIEYPVQTADIFPTALEAVGLAAPKGIDGINLKNDDQNRLVAIVQKPSAWVVDEYDNQYIRTLRAFIIGDEKIILSSNGPAQVYNLKEDPEEKHNIATSRMEIVRKASAEFSKRSAVKLP